MTRRTAMNTSMTAAVHVIHGVKTVDVSGLTVKSPQQA